MKKNHAIQNQDRRSFLRKTAAAGTGVAAASLAGTEVLAASSETAPEAPAKKGYQLSEHVLKYYKSATI